EGRGMAPTGLLHKGLYGRGTGQGRRNSGLPLSAPTSLYIPHKQFSSAAATGQLRAIRTPYHPVDAALMPLQPLEEHAISPLPQVYAAIIVTSSQLRAVRTPSETNEHRLVGLPDPTQATRRHIPHLYSLLMGSTSQLASIRAPCHTQQYGGTPKPLETDTRGCIPQADGGIPSTTGHKPAIRTPSYSKHDPGVITQDL